MTACTAISVCVNAEYEKLYNPTMSLNAGIFANMAATCTREPNASAPEHVHPHEQIGFCLEGEMVFTINGKDYTVHAGEYYHIPPSAPHAERNDGRKAAILTDFFSPVRSDLLQRHFDPEIVGNTAKESTPKGGER